jgi:hypothetical protein
LYYISSKIKTTPSVFGGFFVPWSQSASSSAKKGSYKKLIIVSIIIPYRNRHDTLSLNVTVLGGASGKVYYVNSKCPGSFNDCRVLQSSNLWDTMEHQQELPFPTGLIAGKTELYLKTRLKIASVLTCVNKKLKKCQKNNKKGAKSVNFLHFFVN